MITGPMCQNARVGISKTMPNAILLDKQMKRVEIQTIANANIKRDQEK
jgi:uridylate kinase